MILDPAIWALALSLFVGGGEERRPGWRHPSVPGSEQGEGVREELA